MEVEATRRGGRAATGTSQSIDRAALLLTLFTPAEPVLSLAQLAARLELKQSTVYRYVATLLATGLLERNGRRGGYRLGLRVVELAGVALNQIEVRKEALPEMDRLRDEMRVLVNLALLDGVGGDVIHIAHSAPQGWPPRATTPGQRAVAHGTALGKVLLAHQPWDAVREAIERNGWRPYTAKTIQDFDRLAGVLAEIRERGFSIDDEERAIGTVCLAAPIRDHSGGVVAALSISGTAERLAPGSRSEPLRRLVDAANRVSYRLGAPGTLAY